MTLRNKTGTMAGSVHINGEFAAMRYRVIEDLGASEKDRYQVQASRYGRVWAIMSYHADQISAEVEMERAIAPPRVLASGETED